MTGTHAKKLKNVGTTKKAAINKLIAASERNVRGKYNMLYTKIRDLFQDEVETYDLVVTDIFGCEISIDEIKDVWKTDNDEFIHDSDLDVWLKKQGTTYDEAINVTIFEAEKADFREMD